MRLVNRSYGYLGMGIMGVEMSLNLLKAGYSVLVWNRTPEKVRHVHFGHCIKRSCECISVVVSIPHCSDGVSILHCSAPSLSFHSAPEC